MNDKMIELSNRIFELFEEYRQEFYKEHKPKKAMVWIKNNDTNELVLFTKSEYTQDVLKLVNEIDSRIG